MRKRSPSGLARHASVVALATARSCTSHLRKRFLERYSGRYRFARFVFGFDLFLVGVAVLLFAFDAALLFQAVLPRTVGIDLAFRASVIRASDATPVVLHLRVTDALRHEDVTLQTGMPEWTEVLQSEPPLRKDGTVFFGALGPGEERDVRLLLRVRATPGTSVPFLFSLRERGFLGIPAVVTGKETRTVGSSALTVAPATASDAVVSGGSIPLLLTNGGSVPIPLTALHLVKSDGAPSAQFSSGRTIFVSGFSAHSSRVVFLDIGDTSATSVRFGWELQDGAQAVAALERSYAVAPPAAVAIHEPLKSIAGQREATVAYENAGTLAQLFVAHPLQTTNDPFHLYPLPTGAGRVTIPLDPTRAVSSSEWSVLPISGGVLGRRSVGRSRATFPFNAEARYYTMLGDQIGIGPLPPAVGEITSYWIVWTVGPTESALNRLVMSAALPANVRATGKFSSATGGTFGSAADTVTWSVSRLDATGGVPVTFAFEVALTPVRATKGKSVPLIRESSATAVDAQSGETLEARAAGDDTNLSQDQKGKGKGIIR